VHANRARFQRGDLRRFEGQLLIAGRADRHFSRERRRARDPEPTPPRNRR
jgi:hypothetical protein